MMRPSLRYALLILLAFGAGLLIAQQPPLPDTPECQPDSLAREADNLPALFEFDFENAPLESRDNFYKLGLRYLDLAATCGYRPDADERQFIIEQTLRVATLQEIIAAQAIGSDVDAALTELDTVSGDSFNGQLLYNGLEPGLDGTELGCAGCHTGGSSGPLTAGTYTRVTEVRLTAPALEGYSADAYLVESILHPTAYLADEWGAVMPQNYGSRLDTQQLADLLAFMRSQDQALPEATPEATAESGE
jgi:hypothetical protein